MNHIVLNIVEFASFVKIWACCVRIPAFCGTLNHKHGIRFFLNFDCENGVLFFTDLSMHARFFL